MHLKEAEKFLSRFSHLMEAVGVKTEIIRIKYRRDGDYFIKIANLDAPNLKKAAGLMGINQAGGECEIATPRRYIAMCHDLEMDTLKRVSSDLQAVGISAGVTYPPYGLALRNFIQVMEIDKRKLKKASKLMRKQVTRD